MTGKRPPPPGTPSDDRLFNFVDFVSVWRDVRRWREAHPDLAGYHEARYHGFAGTFGVDLDEPPVPPPPKPDWMRPPDRYVILQTDDWVEMMERHWARELHRFALRQEEQWRWFEGPFAGYVEIPMSVMAARGRYGPWLIPVAQARQAIDAMIEDLMRTLYPDAASRTVTADELRAAGFESTRMAPDPTDYW